MTRLADLFDLGEYAQMIDAGYVRVQTHPDLPLSIANYTEKAQYEGVWNATTLTCRGLIFDEAGVVEALPFGKFFNYGDEANTGPLDLSAPVIVTDKMDGSLGISYLTPQGVAVATRGSFTSDQALHASELLATRYPHFRPSFGLTYLWEIIYPGNRIVVDYGDMDDLVLLAVRDITTGHTFTRAGALWPGPSTERFDYGTLADALAAEPRPGREGMVVRYVTGSNAGRMVKIKQADYVALHRIVTGLNARTVWEWIGDGKTVGDLCATIPDDFHGWIEDIARELSTAADDILSRARLAHKAIMMRLDGVDGWTRGDYARLAQKHYRDVAPYLFLLLDGNDDRAEQLAWRAVKPSGARSMVNHSEAVA